MDMENMLKELQKEANLLERHMSWRIPTGAELTRYMYLTPSHMYDIICVWHKILSELELDGEPFQSLEGLIEDAQEMELSPETITFLSQSHGICSPYFDRLTRLMMDFDHHVECTGRATTASYLDWVLDTFENEPGLEQIVADIYMKMETMIEPDEQFFKDLLEEFNTKFEQKTGSPLYEGEF
jgi:hypothetical protein